MSASNYPDGGFATDNSQCRAVSESPNHEHCFSVGRHPVVGRFARATRDIAPLEVALAERPAVVFPQTRHGPVCLVCLRREGGGRDKTQ